MKCVYEKSSGKILGMFPDSSDTTRIITNWQNCDCITTDLNPSIKEIGRWIVDVEQKILVQNPNYSEEVLIASLQ
jgi:hypothetical protein